jgi:hypothetical protein
MSAWLGKNGDMMAQRLEYVFCEENTRRLDTLVGEGELIGAPPGRGPE